MLFHNHRQVLGECSVDGGEQVGFGVMGGHVIAPGEHHTLHHIQAHFGVDFQKDFEDVRWHDVALI